ncbi:MAG TPA: hypothetical protein VJA66_11795 [Thermoanaerobaculia bacterium]
MKKSVASLVVCAAACLAMAEGAPPSRDAATLRLALNAEKLAAPAGQTLPAFETIEFLPRGEGRYDVRLTPGDNPPSIEKADLRLLVPRVPRLAKGNAALTRLALIQREFNRNEVHFALPGGEDFSIANNCLEQGRWEVKLARAEADKTVTLYHAWLTFPKAEYARLFEEINRIPYGDYDGILAAYPGVGGFPLPLESLRTAKTERALAQLDRHASDPIQRLSEQQRKTKLLQTPEIATYGDFTLPARQPVRMAKFNGPGVYDDKESMRFDLTWLARPSRLVWREVARDGVTFPEIEAVFENGYRVLIADSRLSELPARTEPRSEADVLKLVCGIGTPVIQASAADRASELAEDRPRYLMLLDPKGNHIDNHLTGVDGVYVWREAGNPGLLHLWLVGYERIAFVAHLSAAWPGAAPAKGAF